MIKEHYICNSCHDEFDYKTSYYAHLGMIEVTCPNCGSKFTEKSSETSKLFLEATELYSKSDARKDD